jgi:hypothetical protein
MLQRIRAWWAKGRKIEEREEEVALEGERAQDAVALRSVAPWMTEEDEQRDNEEAPPGPDP